MKTKHSLSNPSYLTLCIVLILYGIFITFMMVFAIKNQGQVKTILGVFTFITVGIVGLYLLFAPAKMVQEFVNNRKETGVVKSIRRGKQMLPFIGTVFSSIVNYVFSFVYLIMCFNNNQFFYLFISLFYLVALIIKYFILSNVYTDEQKKIIRNFIISSIGIIILGIFMALIVFYVINAEGNFTRSKVLLVFSIIIAVIKCIQAIRSFNKHRKKKSYLKLSLSLIAISFMVFTLFTIHVCLLNIYDKAMFSLYFTGLPFATAILAIGIAAFIKGVKSYKELSKYEEETDETL